MKRVLFILKRREDYNAAVHSNIGLSTGLYNSAKFVNDMLVGLGVESKLVVVTDNNDIDREVTAFKPTDVIIEALWVVPSKFTVLQSLHPTVKWIIRLHSELPFMAGEGIAMDWLGDYSDFKNLMIGINAPRMYREIANYLKLRNGWTAAETAAKIVYLPNYYPETVTFKTPDYKKEFVDVGCFGAVRPLKNHLVQAFAAIDFAEKVGKKLRFHINAGRIEMKGDTVVANLMNLFEQLHLKGHYLLNHQWTPREDFLKLCATMDMGLQCSFSETFNIVGADLITQGVPVITSKEIPWAAPDFNADPTSSADITAKMLKAYRYPRVCVDMHHQLLVRYVRETQQIWAKYFK